MSRQPFITRQELQQELAAGAAIVCGALMFAAVLAAAFNFRHDRVQWIVAAALLAAGSVASFIRLHRLSERGGPDGR